MTQPNSNPLRKELARSQQGGSHPDSDMLTAFAEGSLLARERESVLSHLAICTQCREELSLSVDASPEVAEEQPLQLPRPTRPPLRSWLPWAAAASVLVVSSALVVHQQWKPPSQVRSSDMSAATKEAAQPPAQQSPLLPPPEPKAATAPQSLEANGSIAHGEPVPQQQGNSPTAPTVSSVPQQSQSAQSVSPPSEVMNSNDHSGGASRALDAKKAEASRVEGYSTSRTQDSASSNQMAKAKAFPATSQGVGVHGAVEAGTTSGFATVSPVPMIRKATAAGTVRPHWRINDLGQLERSFGEADWQPVPTRETSKLRVVSVSGSDVWAGGENLRLEHSSDNGSTWQVIKLPPKNDLNHAVTHIRFSTPQQGVIDSDDGTSWNTADGGMTWK